MSNGIKVLDAPTKYSFVEAYRSLQLDLQRRGFSGVDRIRVSPLLDLNYPRSEVADVQECYDHNGDIYFDMRVNLMGLYGSLSPLPKFITEELIQGVSRDEWGAKLFLDILHQHLYALLYRTRIRYLPHNTEAQKRNNPALLLSLAGLENSGWFHDFPDQQFLLRHINIFRHQRSTATGLKTLFKGLFKTKNVSLKECDARHVNIPFEQQTQLQDNTAVLGEASILGHQLSDVQGKITINIHEVSELTFNYWVMSHGHWQALSHLIREFLGMPLIIWLFFEVETNTSYIDSEKQLGRNTWLAKSQNHTTGKTALIRLL